MINYYICIMICCCIYDMKEILHAAILHAVWNNKSYNSIIRSQTVPGIQSWNHKENPDLYDCHVLDLNVNLDTFGILSSIWHEFVSIIKEFSLVLARYILSIIVTKNQFILISFSLISNWVFLKKEFTLSQRPLEAGRWI